MIKLKSQIFVAYTGCRDTQFRGKFSDIENSYLQARLKAIETHSSFCIFQRYTSGIYSVKHSAELATNYIHTISNLATL